MRSRLLALVGILCLLLCVALLLRRQQAHPPVAPDPAVASKGSDPLPSAVPPASPPSARHWSIGTRRTYQLHSLRRIDLMAKSQPGAAAAPTGEQAQRFEISVTGLWHETVLQVSPLSVTVEVQLANLLVKLDGNTLQARQLGEGLHLPFYVLLSNAGAVQALRLPSQLDPTSRGILKALVSGLQFVRGAGDRWTAAELDTTGEYDAEYQASADRQQVTKRRQRYTRVSSAQGLMPVGAMGKLDGALQLTYVLAPGEDEATRIVSAVGTDALSVDPGAGMPQVRSVAELAFRFQDSTPVDDVAARLSRLDSDGYVLSALSQTDEDPDSARRSDEQVVQGARFDDLMQKLLALPATGSGADRAELLTRLSASLRLSPQDAVHAQELIKKGLPQAAASTLLGAMAGAGTPAAQASLGKLVEDSTLSSDLRTHSAAMLGLSEDPTDQTVTTLGQLLSHRDPDLRSTAALALGNASLAQRTHGHTSEAEQAVDELLAKLEAAQSTDDQILYLQALGNAGDARTLPQLQRFVASSDVAVRTAAVTALRFLPAEAVDPLLSQILQTDAAIEVRKSAVFAIGYRAVLGHLPALRQAVLSDAAVEVRLAIVQLLGRSLELPGVTALLERVATQDASPEVKQAAARQLRPGR